MSLRSRLVLGAAATVALAVILASVAVYFIVRSELEGQVDRTLQTNAASIVSSASASREGFGFVVLYAPNVYELISHTPPLSGYFQLVTASGAVYIPGDYIAKTPPIAVTTRAEAVAAGRVHAYDYDTQFEGQEVRVLTLRTQIETSVAGSGLAPRFPTSEGVALQVATSLTGVNNELSRIRLWLLLIALGGVAVASSAGLLVARSTLRPVRDLSETAERVRATRDLSQRINVGAGDELGQLARTFNEMLAALDDAAKRQRQLVQDASHELRTPLTSLRTNIEVLADGDSLSPEDRTQLLHDVIGQLGEMTALISELTALARGEEQAYEPEEVRLDLVAEEAVRRTLRNHPDAVVETDAVAASVVANPAALERAVANLLDNAAKWNRPGVPIEVRVRNGEVTVRDHGPGIAEADVPHIFERFYRATSARSMPGSGLGLAIVQQVAEANGGSITCEQPPGGGTLMRLRLPTGTLPAAPDGKRPPASPPGAAEPVHAGAAAMGKRSLGRLAATRSRLRSGDGGRARADHGGAPGRRIGGRRGD